MLAIDEKVAVYRLSEENGIKHLRMEMVTIILGMGTIY